VATATTRSVWKAFQLLRSLRSAGDWLTGAELSRLVGLPATSGHRLLQTLEEVGAVVRDTRGRYRPGMLLFDATCGLSRNEVIREAANPLLLDLSHRVQATVHVAVLEDGMVTYLAKIDTVGHEVITVVGSQLEAYCTALGKVLLAGLPAAEIDAYLAGGKLVPITEFTITDPASLRDQLNRIRMCGYAIDDREILPDLKCVAVPIKDRSGRTLAAMSASDVWVRMAGERQEAVTAELRRTARALSDKLFPVTESSPARAGGNPVQALPDQLRHRTARVAG
jgi:IclR family acetate operon transcriptional repressor